MTTLIRDVLDASPFVGEGHRKVWARLRAKQVRVGRGRVLRLMREANLLAPTRMGNAHGPSIHDGTIITETPDEMWGTDMTATATTQEGNVAVFIAVDHCTSECVGIHAAKYGNRFEALEPIRQGIREQMGAVGKGVASGLTLRHDHGSCYMAKHFQKEIKFLGVESSTSYVREPEGNGCAERFIRTLKEQVLWVEHFETVDDLLKALQAFKDRYNRQWLIERHGHRPPAEVRASFRESLQVAA